MSPSAKVGTPLLMERSGSLTNKPWTLCRCGVVPMCAGSMCPLSTNGSMCPLSTQRAVHVGSILFSELICREVSVVTGTCMCIGNWLMMFCLKIYTGFVTRLLSVLIALIRSYICCLSFTYVGTVPKLFRTCMREAWVLS